MDLMQRLIMVSLEKEVVVGRMAMAMVWLIATDHQVSYQPGHQEMLT
jgi:hypothetical protein